MRVESICIRRHDHNICQQTYPNPIEFESMHMREQDKKTCILSGKFPVPQLLETPTWKWHLIEHVQGRTQDLIQGGHFLKYVH